MKTKKYLRQFHSPIQVLCWTISFLLFGFYIYLTRFLQTNNSQSKESIEFFSKLFEAYTILVATLGGVGVSLAFDYSKKREVEKRNFAFGLSSIWFELRDNYEILNSINNIYTFSQILDQIPSLSDLSTALEVKYKTIFELSKSTHKDSFIALQQSGQLSLFDSDDLFNMVNQAYANLSILRTNIKITLLDIKMKKFISNQKIDPINPNEPNDYKEQMRFNISGTQRHLIIAIESLDKAITSIDNKLTKDFEIKAETEKSDTNVERQKSKLN